MPAPPDTFNAPVDVDVAVVVEGIDKSPEEFNSILLTPGVNQRNTPPKLSICQFCVVLPLKNPIRGLGVPEPVLPINTPEAVVFSLNSPEN